MLSDRAKSFIHTSVKSIWALELLLFLRSNAQRSWSAAELTRELRASEAVVRGGLGLFRAAGLIQEDPAGRVRFAPTLPDTEALVREVAEVYATHPVEVSDEIYVTERTIQHFADAFRLRKE